MAGSLVQAEVVYNYFTDYCEIDPSIRNHIKGNVTMTETEGVANNTFSCVTASPKQVRGKHPDTLISDETCETSDELVYAALPMVNDSKTPLVIMASTFHKIYGVFQETWDNAAQRGYLRISWDIFDVCSEFPADYWENGVLHDGTLVRNILGIEKLKRHAAGRTGDPDGWIPVENVVQAWREKPSEDWFEVEYLGSRPSAAGLVLKPEDVDAAMFDQDYHPNLRYTPGATVVIGIDWGFSSMTAVVELMGHADENVVMLDNQNFTQVGSEDIIKNVLARVRRHKVRFIYADSAGKFENDALQKALNKAGLGCKVIEVVFSKEKEGMLGNLRAHFERRKIRIPRFYARIGEKGETLRIPSVEAYWQHKRYRYQDGTDKPVKKDDHIPDATQCALQHFKLGAHTASVPTQARAEKRDRLETEAVPGPSDKPITAELMHKTF